jgi:hypothetical protein
VKLIAIINEDEDVLVFADDDQAFVKDTDGVTGSYSNYPASSHVV